MRIGAEVQALPRARGLTAPGAFAIRAVTGADLPFLAALNGANETETSALDDAALARLVGQSFAALTDGAGAGGFLIALDETAAYGSVNFQWFRRRYDRFVYVDRLIVAAPARRGGLARALYAALLARARDAGHTRVVCEVNAVPPNPASASLHAALRFQDVGGAVLEKSGKTVRYLARGVEPTV